MPGDFRGLISRKQIPCAPVAGGGRTTAAPRGGGPDSHRRPLGYEPSALPPALPRYAYIQLSTYRPTPGAGELAFRTALPGPPGGPPPRRAVRSGCRNRTAQT